MADLFWFSHDQWAVIEPFMPTAPRTGEKGEGCTQAIGPSRGGQTTKVHVLTDVLGRLAVIHLTPGNASDVRTAPDVLAQAPGRMRRLLADRGYDADALRAALRNAGTMLIIPGRRCRKRSIRHDKRRYQDRWRIEAAICRLMDFRRVATRYDKLAANFASAVALAAVVAFWCWLSSNPRTRRPKYVRLI